MCSENKSSTSVFSSLPSTSSLSLKKSPAESTSSWLRKTLVIGRTPSLPSSFSKTRHSFLKKFKSRKISTSCVPHSQYLPQVSSLAVNSENKQCQNNSTEMCRQNNTDWIHEYSSTNCCNSLITMPGIQNKETLTQESDDSGETITKTVQVSDGSLYNIIDETQIINHSPTPKLETKTVALAHATLVSVIPFLPENGSLPQLTKDEFNTIEKLSQKNRLQNNLILNFMKEIDEQKADIKSIQDQHLKQLNSISFQIFHFESNLRKKEIQLQEILDSKDEIILKQQRLIKKLLRPIGSHVAFKEFDKFGYISSLKRILSSPAILEGTFLNANNELMKCQIRTTDPKTQSDPETQHQTDTDSAIILDDHINEVSLSVPNLILENNNEITVIRSISDVLKTIENNDKKSSKDVGVLSSTLVSKPPTGRKSKKERQMSNRHKLMSLQRFSGYLKRPEVLETVYSVEEDTGENPAILDNLCAEKTSFKNIKKHKIDDATDDVNCIISHKTQDNASNNNCKQITDDNTITTSVPSVEVDYNSLDKKITKGEEEESISTLTQQVFLDGLNPKRLTASTYSDETIWFDQSKTSICLATTDTSKALPGADDTIKVKYNRIMCNHRAVIKPKDIKFRRINKVKSRSLEELRVRLKWHKTSSF